MILLWAIAMFVVMIVLCKFIEWCECGGHKAAVRRVQGSTSPEDIPIPEDAHGGKHAELRRRALERGEAA